MIYLIILIVFFIWCLHNYGNRALFAQLALCFLFSCQVNTVIDMVVVNHKMLDFPVRLFKDVSNISITFDYVLFPIFHCFYYQWTHRLNWIRAFGTATLMTAALTFVEHLFLRYTDFVVYYTWTSYYTFFTVLLSLLVIRFVVRFWFREELKRLN
jgi:hypothetical protein